LTIFQSIDKLKAMTRVSKKPLKENTFNEIIDTLWEVVAELDDKELAGDFLKIFLSKAEKVMLAKRLAIAVMIQSGFGPIDISQTLKVSTATVRDVSYKLEKEEFGKVTKKFMSKFKSEKHEMSWLEAVLTAKTSMKARARVYRG